MAQRSAVHEEIKTPMAARRPAFLPRDLVIEPDESLFIGVDVGTQGVRTVVSDACGRVHARARKAFPDEVAAATEQDPDLWWGSVSQCLRTLTRELGSRAKSVRCLAITSTSGTLCLLDGRGNPLRPALLYADRRSGAQAQHLNEIVSGVQGRAVATYDASFSLPKLLWLRDAEPECYAATRFFASPGDFFVGRLTGNYQLTDYSQALKLGFDVEANRWPPHIQETLGVDGDRLPSVAAFGTPAGDVLPEVCAETGLPWGTAVNLGATDGVAGHLACAPAPGRWATILGTTLIWKGMTKAPLSDPLGRVYNHRGPDGTWLPGAAGNCGGRVLQTWFGGSDLSDRDANLAPLPTGLLVYPLIGTGERYPVRNPQAAAFVVGEHGGEDDPELYTACLEGVAFVERWGYDVIRDLGGPITGAIATTGGASHSDPWLRIRASVLGCPVEAPEESEPAFGAAILATVGHSHENVVEAAAAMVAWAKRMDPDRDLADRYENRYALFREQCMEHGIG